MQVVGNRTIKTIGAGAPGELVRVSNGEAGSLGIIAAKREDDVFVALLEDPYEGHPRLLLLDNDDKCLSYGVDWCLHPVEGAEAYPYHHEVNRRSGLLALKGEQWFMSVASSGVDALGRFSIEWVNLTNPGQGNDGLRGSAFFAKWNIWLNGERGNPHASPLFQFEAKPRQPRT
ncbi:hypothetical protein KYK30_32045 [Shinella yambaruensis]|uniref:Uncharacterized protein n=1 Tax=Shinella yambaruensis TaxID=415996 RepID=A0ABQ5ZQI0_9HYPH|nr:hypothetical protein [Shinella yambaruensis]MCJ8030066.1 hypothetical protein [Shinella yambaruensis]MCU7984359.1 hypothetical protein [Shinella yambaruensis]GLR54345.1 hypothetical protein GCM10007923_55620 [Shinella yambaruensis]